MATFSKRRPGSRLGVERLEDRLLLAGNVRAWIAGDDLIVRGDDLANGMYIAPGPDGAFVLTGTYQQGPTTVNGQTDPVVLKPTDDVWICLYGGDDLLRVPAHMAGSPQVFAPDLVIPGDLVVVTHAGNDTVELDWSVEVGNDAWIYTREGNDHVSIEGMRVGGDLYVRNPFGHCQVGVQYSSVGGDAVIRTGEQTDEVSLEGMWVADDLFVYTYGDEDSVSLQWPRVGDNTVISTGSGNDSFVTYRADFGTDLRVATGRGDDFLGVGLATVGRKAYLFTYSGADTVRLSETTVADYLCVDTGTGDDLVGLQPDLSFYPLGPDVIPETGVAAKECRVITGEGSDALAVAASTFDRNLRLYTGSGDDAIFVTGTKVGNLFYADAGIGNDAVTVEAYLGDYDTGYYDNGWNGPPPQDFGLKAKYARISTGTGNDNAVLKDLVIEEYLYAWFLSGDDVAQMADIVARDLVVDMGSDNDDLGLHFTNMQIARRFLAFGGPDEDSLKMDGPRPGNFRCSGFESAIA